MRQRAGVLSLVGGLLTIALAHALSPVAGPPLYDGVVPEEPYRYLSPPPGAQGNPTSYQNGLFVTGSTSPSIAAATSESPPQAQLITDEGAIALPTGAASVTVVIRAVPPPAPPPAGTLMDGNVYEIAVRDQADRDLALAKPVTVVLRGPLPAPGGTLAVYAGGAWQRLESFNGTLHSMVGANAPNLGDFAILTSATVAATPEPGSQSPGGGSSNDLFLIGVVALVAVALAGGGALLIVRRRRSRAIAP